MESPPSLFHFLPALRAKQFFWISNQNLLCGSFKPLFCTPLSAARENRGFPLLYGSPSGTGRLLARPLVRAFSTICCLPLDLSRHPIPAPSPSHGTDAIVDPMQFIAASVSLSEMGRRRSQPLQGARKCGAVQIDLRQDSPSSIVIPFSAGSCP